MIDKKVELSFWNRTWHHWPTIMFLFIGLLMFHISTVKPSNPTHATMSPKSIIIFGLILCGLAIVIFIWLENKLRFDKIEIGFDRQTAIKIILTTADKNRWFVNNDIVPDSKRIELTKLNPWSATSNEIVIELGDKYVLVNARGNYPTDRKIIKKLRAALTERG